MSLFATPKVIRMMRAFLKILSLNAPRNWVAKKGKKRFEPSNPDGETMYVSSGCSVFMDRVKFIFV